MQYSPALIQMLVDERQHEIERAIRSSPVLAHHHRAPRADVGSVGPPAYYRGIAVAVWRAALRPGAALARPTVAAPADRGLGQVQLCS